MELTIQPQGEEGGDRLGTRGTVGLSFSEWVWSSGNVNLDVMWVQVKKTNVLQFVSPEMTCFMHTSGTSLYSKRIGGFFFHQKLSKHFYENYLTYFSCGFFKILLISGAGVKLKSYSPVMLDFSHKAALLIKQTESWVARQLWEECLPELRESGNPPAFLWPANVSMPNLASARPNLGNIWIYFILVEAINVLVSLITLLKCNEWVLKIIQTAMLW